ncbi:MAG TPA: hypothetical protein VMU77_02455, partial [Acidimicrobiales bacterium]|nr:hypothetical protein [Acidimicrobiales bacterium]
DGSVWTSETSATGVAALGLLEPQQQKVLQFPLPSAQGEIGGIALDIHGNLWFTEPAVGKIGRLTPTGNVRSWFLPPYSGTDPGIKAWGAPSAITVGPDGAVWFTESTNYFDSATRALGIAASRDTSSALNGSGNTGSSGSASASGTNGGASSISSTAGSNQLGQFPQADGIGRIDPTTGMITEIQLPPSLAAPDSIVADQNRLWFVTDTAIGSITPGSGQAGSVQVFPVPANWLLAKDSQSIVAGSDGSLWFASKDIATPTVVNAVKMDPASGSMTTFPTNVIGSQKITDFAASASGPVWFSTLGGNSIGLISNNDSVTQFRIPDQATSATPPLPIGLSADKQNGNVWLAELGTGQLALLSAPGGSGQLTAPT